MYDAKNKTEFTFDDCEQAVGERATLTLTGTVVEARVSEAGPHIVFRLDDRWGFAQDKLVMDLDPLDFP